MQILIVNGFEVGNEKSESIYRIFFDLVRSVFTNSSCSGSSSLSSINISDCNFIERNINQLADLVVDWTHESLKIDSRECCENFDKLDFVFVAGDMHSSSLPWQPVAGQLITLLHMCQRTKKPLFCSGSGAFAAVYAMATKGARFNIVNAPWGGNIEQLPMFPHHYSSSPAHPGGWLDSETGDIYSYYSRQQVWLPVCNTGVYLIRNAGKPAQNRFAPQRQKKYARDDHNLHLDQIVTAIGPDADCARIRSRHVQHYAVRGLPAQNFAIKCYPNWYIRSSSSCLTESNNNINSSINNSNSGSGSNGGRGCVVVADCCSKGGGAAALICKDNMLLLPTKIDASTSTIDNNKRILANFVELMVQRKLESRTGHIEKSLKSYLFGSDGCSGGSYDSVRDAEQMSPPMAQQPVPAAAAVRTAGGPVEVAPPALDIFFFVPKTNNFDFLALTAARRTSTLGRRPKYEIRNPLSARQTRLDGLYRIVGEQRTAVATTAAAAASGDEFCDGDSSLPAALRALRSGGEVMRDEHISPRRHNRQTHGRVHQSHAQSPLAAEAAAAAVAAATAAAATAAELDDGEEEFGLLPAAAEAATAPFRAQQQQSSSSQAARGYRASVRGTNYLMPVTPAKNHNADATTATDATTTVSTTNAATAGDDFEATDEELLLSKIITRVPTFASSDDNETHRTQQQQQQHQKQKQKQQLRSNEPTAASAAAVEMLQPREPQQPKPSALRIAATGRHHGAPTATSTTVVTTTITTTTTTAATKAAIKAATTVSTTASTAAAKTTVAAEAVVVAGADEVFAATAATAVFDSAADLGETMIEGLNSQSIKFAQSYSLDSADFAADDNSNSDSQLRPQQQQLLDDDDDDDNSINSNGISINRSNYSSGNSGDNSICPVRGFDLEQSQLNEESLQQQQRAVATATAGEEAAQKQPQKQSQSIKISQSTSSRYARVVVQQQQTSTTTAAAAVDKSDSDSSESEDEELQQQRQQMFWQHHRRNSVPHPLRHEQRLQTTSPPPQQQPQQQQSDTTATAKTAARKVPVIPDFHAMLQQQQQQRELHSLTARPDDQRLLILQLKNKATKSARAAEPNSSNSNNNAQSTMPTSAAANAAAANAATNLKRNAAADARRRRKYRDNNNNNNNSKNSNSNTSPLQQQRDRRVSAYLPSYARSTHANASSARHNAANVAAASAAEVALLAQSRELSAKQQQQQQLLLQLQQQSSVEQQVLLQQLLQQQQQQLQQLLPQSARSAGAITSARQQLRLPVQHPTGPLQIAPAVSMTSFFWHPSSQHESGGFLHSVAAPESNTTTAAEGRIDYGLLGDDEAATVAFDGWDDFNSVPSRAPQQRQQQSAAVQRMAAASSYLNEVSQTSSYTLQSDQLPIELRTIARSQQQQQQQQQIAVEVRGGSPVSRPYSSYRRIAKRLEQQQQERSGDYRGQYLQPYSPPEQQRRQQQLLAKQRNVSQQEFRTHFGAASTALQLRKAGCLQADGPFPRSPGLPLPVQLPAKYWVALQPAAASNTAAVTSNAPATSVAAAGGGAAVAVAAELEKQRRVGGSWKI